MPMITGIMLPTIWIRYMKIILQLTLYNSCPWKPLLIMLGKVVFLSFTPLILLQEKRRETPPYALCCESMVLQFRPFAKTVVEVIITS